MKFFNWGNDDAPAAPSLPADTGGIATTQVTDAREKIAADVQARKRGRPPKDTGDIRSDSQIIQAEISKQLEACYDPKAWGALLSLPADAALALTARENWKISKDERDTLGAAGGAAARTLMITNPRSLAFLMLASALFSVYVPRAIQEMKHHAAKKMKAEDDKKRQSGA